MRCSSIYNAWNMVPNAIMGNASSARNRFDGGVRGFDKLPNPYPRPALLRGPGSEPKAGSSVRGSTRCITFCKILNFWLGEVRVRSLPLLLSDLLYSFRAHQQCSFTQACTINTGTTWEMWWPPHLREQGAIGGCEVKQSVLHFPCQELKAFKVTTFPGTQPELSQQSHVVIPSVRRAARIERRQNTRNNLTSSLRKVVGVHGRMRGYRVVPL